MRRQGDGWRMWVPPRLSIDERGICLKSVVFDEIILLKSVIVGGG